MLLHKLNGWKISLGALSVAILLTGCASTGDFFAKMKPSSIRKVWNKSRTGLEEPAEVHQSYAAWQEQQGNLTEARQSYEYVLESDPKSVEAILGLARLDQLAGQTKQSEELISRAQAIAPNDPAVLNSLGQFYISQGRFSEATDVLQQAAILSPNDVAIQYQLGVALARTGDLDRARPYFIRTVGEAEAHYNIAYILNEKGQSVAAEQELMASLQKKPTLQTSQVLLEQIRRQHMQSMVAGGYGAPQQAIPQAALPVQQPMQQAVPQQTAQVAYQPQQAYAPVQQVNAQVVGNPQQQRVVEAYWQGQNGSGANQQVTHASVTVMPQNNVPQNGLPQIGGAVVPQPAGAMIQQQIVVPQQPALEQWNPQLNGQR